MKTIKVSEENYRRLLRVGAALQKKRGEKISFDKTLNEMFEQKPNGSIMELAGSWKMSDEEWNEIKDGFDHGWKKWKHRSV